MKQIDKKKIENWRPYAFLTLVAGGVAAIGTIVTFGEKAWAVLFPESSFSGRVTGVGGVNTRDNHELIGFLSSSVGKTAEIALTVVYDFSPDPTPMASTCVSESSTAEIFEIDSVNHVFMSNEHVQEFEVKLGSELFDLGDDQTLSGNSFFVTYSAQPCEYYILSLPDVKAELSYVDTHSFEVALSGKFFVSLNQSSWPPKFILTSRNN